MSHSSIEAMCDAWRVAVVAGSSLDECHVLDLHPVSGLRASGGDYTLRTAIEVRHGSDYIQRWHLTAQVGDESVRELGTISIATEPIDVAGRGLTITTWLARAEARQDGAYAVYVMDEHASDPRKPEPLRRVERQLFYACRLDGCWSFKGDPSAAEIAVAFASREPLDVR